MVDDAGGTDEFRMWRAVERLEISSQATREEQVAMNARLDNMREEQIATNVRIDAIREEQIAANSRVDAIEKEQASMNARLNAIEKEQAVTNAQLQTISETQHKMTMRIDSFEARVTTRIDRLFYAIIGGTITVAAAVVVHGLISG